VCVCVCHCVLDINAIVILVMRELPHISTAAAAAAKYNDYVWQIIMIGVLMCVHKFVFVSLVSFVAGEMASAASFNG
jgi:hypothetical protein